LVPGTAEGTVSPNRSSVGITSPGGLRDPRLVFVGRSWPGGDRDGSGVAGWVALILEEAGAPAPGLRPTVGQLDSDLFREGDRVRVDGALGVVDLDGVEAVSVVTAFLERPDGRILLLRRSEAVGTFRGRWAGVSGFLEDANPEAQAVREIWEETGIPAESLDVVIPGPLVYARDRERVFVVHPFRVRVTDARYRLDWEHSEAEWVDPSEILRRPTVPKLDRVWAAVARASSGPPAAPPEEPS